MAAESTLSKPYCIVEFTNEGKVEACPSSWLDRARTMSWWPIAVTSAQLNRTILNRVPPDLKKGQSHPIRVMGYAGKWLQLHVFTSCTRLLLWLIVVKWKRKKRESARF